MKKTFPILLTVLMVLSLASVAGYMFYQKTVASPGVPSIHFYTVSAVESIAEIARRIY